MLEVGEVSYESLFLAPSSGGAIVIGGPSSQFREAVRSVEQEKRSSSRTLAAVTNNCVGRVEREPESKASHKYVLMAKQRDKQELRYSMKFNNSGLIYNWGSRGRKESNWGSTRQICNISEIMT